MKPNEWAAIIFGLTGLVLSSLSFFKSLATERRNKMQDLAQKRSEALLAILDAETEVYASRRAYESLRSECAQERHDEYIKMADEMIGFCDKKLDAIEVAKSEVRKSLPVDQYDAVYDSLDRVATDMRVIAKEANSKERDRDMIEATRENLRLARQLKESQAS